MTLLQKKLCIVEKSLGNVHYYMWLICSCGMQMGATLTYG